MPHVPRTPVRDVGHLGDFTATPRMLFVAAIAVPVGAAGAGAAWTLVRLIGIITNAVFYQRWGTQLVAPGSVHHNPLLVLLAPILGGLAIGFMARYGSERIRGHGMPETIEAILLRRSTIQPRVAVLKPISAAVGIGTGGPFGAEGPIIMTGGALGSLFAQFLHLTADERKTLLVAGATAGMAATFNAPLASVLLAVDLLLFEWRPRSFVPVATAIAVATILRGPLLGHGTLFPSTAAFDITYLTYAFCLVAGVCSALLAIVATTLVYFSEDLFHRLPFHWMWWPAIGGLIIGIGGLVQPRALGVGYDVIDAELTGQIGLSLVLSVLVVKTLIWSLSLGSGTSGGVLAPMFIIGGALGAVESHVFPEVGLGFWAIIGLAGVLGGVMRTPFTGVVFAIELTGRFDALLPLLIATSTAYAASVLLLKRSILTEKIARRGFHLGREYDVDPLEALFVDQVLTEDYLDLAESRSVASALLEIQVGSDDVRAQRLYPVVDDDRTLVGIVSGSQLEAAVSVGRRDDPVGLLAGASLVVAHGDDTLKTAAALMAETGFTRLPVTMRGDPLRPIGVVSLKQLLAGRLRDLAEERDTERLLRLRTPRLPRRNTATARSPQPRRRTPARASSRHRSGGS